MNDSHGRLRRQEVASGAQTIAGNPDSDALTRTSEEHAKAATRERSSSRPRGARAQRAAAVAAMTYAGFWRRMLAAEVDLLLILGVGGGLGAVIYSLCAALPFTAPHASNAALGGVLLVQLAYGTWFEASAWRATPGKRLLGLRVTRRDGAPLTRPQALLRNALKWVSLLPLAAGVLLILFTKRKQALHDVAVDSLVMRKSGQLPVAASKELPLVATVTVVVLFLFVFSGNLLSGNFFANARGKLVVLTSLNALRPAMDEIEHSYATRGQAPDKLPPTAIDMTKLPPDTTVMYQPGLGSLSLYYQGGLLGQQGFTVLPTYRSGRVEWSCATQMLAPDSRVGLCR